MKSTMNILTLPAGKTMWVFSYSEKLSLMLITWVFRHNSQDQVVVRSVSVWSHLSAGPDRQRGQQVPPSLELTGIRGGVCWLQLRGNVRGEIQYKRRWEWVAYEKDKGKEVLKGFGSRKRKYSDWFWPKKGNDCHHTQHTNEQRWQDSVASF